MSRFSSFFFSVPASFFAAALGLCSLIFLSRIDEIRQIDFTGPVTLDHQLGRVERDLSQMNRRA